MLWPYPRVFVHRCGGALAPENTLCGLPVAAQLGCRAVEFDVMLNGSGTPVLIHDDTVDRTTDGTGRVCELSDRQIFGLDAGNRFHAAFSGTRIPALIETIGLCRTLDLAANVEIKPAAGQDNLVGSEVARHAASGWSDALIPPLLSSFSEEALESASIFAPHLPRGLLVDRVPGDWKSRCARLGVVALHVAVQGLDAQIVREIKAAGLRVVAYTENDPVQAHELLVLGVDSVITDRPDIVRG